MISDLGQIYVLFISEGHNFAVLSTKQVLDKYL